MCKFGFLVMASLAKTSATFEAARKASLHLAPLEGSVRGVVIFARLGMKR